MRDLISETLRKHAKNSKVNVKALQRYFKIKFSLSIDEEVIARRLSFMQKKEAA